jgi:hypothetical protein
MFLEMLPPGDKFDIPGIANPPLAFAADVANVVAFIPLDPSALLQLLYLSRCPGTGPFASFSH